MAEIAPAEEIENIVGIPRPPTQHWGRAVSEREMIFILHSQECFDSDFPNCDFTQALERGIVKVWNHWENMQDRPVRLHIFNGYLHPLVG